MVFGDYCLLAGSPPLPLPSLQQQLVCILVREVLQIKDREREIIRRGGKNKGSLEESSQQHMKVLQVDGNVGLGETGHEGRKKGWWINGMGGMTALGLLRSCGWWGRVLAMVQAREFLQHQNFLQIRRLLWRSNLWEVKFLNHVNWGVFSWKYHFSRNHIFFCRVVFMAHLQEAVLCYLPSWAEIDSFSQGFYHRVVITGVFHPGQSHSRNCDQGGGFYFSFMPEGRSGKMQKNGLSTILAIFSSQK